MSLGTLSQVNVAAKREDAKIAAAFRAGCGGDDPAAAAAAHGVALPLHGLVAISCDVHGVNRCGVWNLVFSASLSPARDKNKNRGWLTAGNSPSTLLRRFHSSAAAAAAVLEQRTMR